MLAWKTGVFQVNILKVTSQLLHCYVQPISGVPSYLCTFVYAFSQPSERDALCVDLCTLRTDQAWVIFRDFNCVRCPKERIGAAVRNNEMCLINVFFDKCGVDNI